jgi:hypothetical protein
LSQASHRDTHPSSKKDADAQSEDFTFQLRAMEKAQVITICGRLGAEQHRDAAPSIPEIYVIDACFPVSYTGGRKAHPA